MSDATLGNVTESGGSSAPSGFKLFYERCYAILLADPQLTQGKCGIFNFIDLRIHKIAHVCRSSYTTETLGSEEAQDSGELSCLAVRDSRSAPADPRRQGRSLQVAPDHRRGRQERLRPLRGQPRLRCAKVPGLDVGGASIGPSKNGTRSCGGPTPRSYWWLAEPSRWIHALQEVLTCGTWSIQHEKELVRSK